MNAVKGRVRGGRIEVDEALPEGAEVVVLTGGGDEPFDLDAEHTAELDARMAAGEQGEHEPAGETLHVLALWHTARGGGPGV